MDIREIRDFAVKQFQKGEPNKLIELILADDLNKVEREFIAEFMSEHAPPKPPAPRGPKRNIGQMVQAELIRYWLTEVDGVTKDAAVVREIATILGVKDSRVRNIQAEYLRPPSQAAALAKFIADYQIDFRRNFLIDPDVVKKWHAHDFEPYSEK